MRTYRDARVSADGDADCKCLQIMREDDFLM